MIGSIIDYARGTAGSRKRAVDMKALCANAIATIDQEEGRLAFRAPEEDCTVNGDPMTLHRLIANLAVNALRYAGGGELTLEGNAHGIVARMADRGPGFPPELAESLFEPFFRVEGSRSRETAGTGLGLATARDVAKRMAAR
jgi:signal transduction histidine kinase